MAVAYIIIMIIIKEEGRMLIIVTAKKILILCELRINPIVINEASDATVPLSIIITHNYHYS